MNSSRFSTQRDKQMSKPDQVGQFWSNKELRWQINIHEFSLYRRTNTSFSESEIEQLADKISNKLIRIVEDQLKIKSAMIKHSVQDKIDRMKKLAEESDSKSTDNKERSSITREDSLAKIITNQKEADAFMADLETAIRLANKKQN
jgi:hypothetical protein